MQTQILYKSNFAIEAVYTVKLKLILLIHFIVVEKNSLNVVP